MEAQRVRVLGRAYTCKRMKNETLTTSNKGQELGLTNFPQVKALLHQLREIVMPLMASGLTLSPYFLCVLPLHAYA